MSFKELRSSSVVVTVSLLTVFGGCKGLQPGVTGATGIQSINHIVYMVQENRSLDNYLGQLPAYLAANGYPQASQKPPFDGLPANASNPSYDGTSTVSAYHLATECTQILSPSWNESHVDWNRTAPTSSTPKMDGFVYTAAHYALNPPAGQGPIYDTAGIRAMGYYDGTDLNYYYFMAANFATSDRWFSPALDRTHINRMYLLAATSQGYAYPIGTNAADSAPLTAPTIFDALQKAGISWKIYVTDPKTTYLTMFAPYAPPNPLPPNVVPASQFLSDAQSGTLPQVALIEGGYESGLDEHPDDNVQAGAQYVASLINGFMASVSWNDSVFILTFDEGGGLYDHVPAQPAVNPDGIAPKDLFPTDICSAPGGANCDFNYTGFRVPLIVISPSAKQLALSPTVLEYTPNMTFIEKRFEVNPLTKSEADQMDMTEFFDFVNVPWFTPPSPPPQTTNGVCND